MSNFDLSVLFFIQLVVILAVCQVVDFLVRRVGQPQMVAEMTAGVFMGPHQARPRRRRDLCRGMKFGPHRRPSDGNI
jgi:Kef-type K+ transport system membrane component KefB